MKQKKYDHWNRLTDMYALVALVILLGASGMLNAQLLPPVENGTADEFAQRRAGAAVNASLKISVTQKGLYKISYNQLVAAGLTGINGQSIRLFNRNEEISRYVSSQGTWSQNDYIIFYGKPHEGYYTQTNVYWLGVGGSGLDMQQQNASPITAAPTSYTYLFSETYDKKDLYRPYYRPWDESINHWFAAYLSNTKDTDTPIPADPLLVPAGTASLSVFLHGLTTDYSANPDHQTRIWINGTQVGNITYDGQSAKNATLSFNANLLQTGGQQIRFRQIPLPGVSSGTDRAYLEQYVLTYPRQLNATADSLYFAGQTGPNNYSIEGLSANDQVWLVEISQPSHPALLTGLQYAAGEDRLSFGLNRAQQPSFMISSSAKLMTVPALESVHFRNLSDTNRQADYIVICPYAFRNSTYEYLRRRYLQGLRVLVAPISDIYNEFSYGIKDAAAIQQFLGYAYHHWQKPTPAYTVMIGRGTYDPMHHLPDHTATDWIPVHLGPGPFEWTAQDNWFGTVNGADKLTDISIGRIPADSQDAVSLLLRKMIAFEEAIPSSNWQKKALLVADKTDGTLNFSAASDSCARTPLQQAGFSTTQAYLDYYTVNQVRSAIAAALNQGAMTISYFGHGAIDFWSDEEILTAQDVRSMVNQVYPVFVALTCANGDFDDPTRTCLSQLLLEQDGGGIACVAAASLPVQLTSDIFAAGYFQALASSTGTVRIGDIMQAGLDKLQDESPGSSELLFYNLLGDPALRIKEAP